MEQIMLTWGGVAISQALPDAVKYLATFPITNPALQIIFFKQRFYRVTTRNICTRHQSICDSGYFGLWNPISETNLASSNNNTVDEHICKFNLIRTQRRFSWRSVMTSWKYMTSNELLLYFCKHYQVVEVLISTHRGKHWQSRNSSSN